MAHTRPARPPSPIASLRAWPSTMPTSSTMVSINLGPRWLECISTSRAAQFASAYAQKTADPWTTQPARAVQVYCQFNLGFAGIANHACCSSLCHWNSPVHRQMHLGYVVTLCLAVFIKMRAHGVADLRIHHSRPTARPISHRGKNDWWCWP